MILNACNINKSFGKKKILKGVSLELKRGEIYGISGENGSGKSTLLKALIGYIRIDSGKVNIFGKFGYCPQNAHFFEELTVKEHFNYFSAAYEINPQVQEESIHFLLEKLNFERYYNHKISDLSSGTIQKLNLSISLLNFPDLLVLDEPYNGFDWDTYLKFWELVSELKEKGLTVLIVSHFLNDLSRFDTSFELKNGKLYEME